MSTNIDSLQIEIVSSSTAAVASIRDLASALGELKSNSKITTAVNNLNNLRKALHSFANIPSNASKVLSLAGSLEKLKTVGSVTAIGNSLTKLATSLKTLDEVRVNKEKIDSIASALGSLSAVKAGGINTMMNGLLKIGKVTESLNEEAIGAFAERIEELTEKLTPLSTKMTTIQSGLKGINSAARSAGSSAKKMGEDVDGASVNMASFIYTIQEAIQWLQQAIQKFSEFISEAIEWDGIAARFGRGFGAQAQETYDWIQRLNKEMGINVQQFMKYSSVYATMLTGFGVANEDATKMALGYTELTYDIWAGYNDIYKNFDDAAEAVKSAIAGEVEPIRRAGFTIVESTLEQTAANHGLSISLEKATEAQKSYLRYLTLVDQAHSQGLVGTYAKELQTAEGLMRTFSQQVKSLTQAFGSLFLPILVKIMPYLQAFVELLTDGIRAIASLFGITIQGVDWSGYQDGIGGAADGNNDLADSANNATEAIKELKNASLGIDELNVISPPSANGGAGGSGGSGGSDGFGNLDVESMWDESIFADIGNQVDAIKEKLKGWLPVVEAVAGVFATMGVALLIANLGESMEAIREMDGLVGGLKQTLAGLAILTIEAVLVFMLADEYLESGNLMSLVGEALATAAGGYLMYKGFGAKGLVMSLVVSIVTQLAAITLNLADGGVEMDDPELWIQSAFTTALGGTAGGLLAYKGLIKTSTGKGVGLGLLATLSLNLTAITIGDVAADGEVTGSNILTALGSVVAAAGFGFSVGGPWGALIGAGVALAINIIGVIFALDDSVEEELADRFGNVELSISEVKVLVDKLTPEWKDETAQAVQLREDVAQLVKSIESREGALGAYEWQVGVGIGLTQDEMSVYAGTIEKFITDCQDYVTERGYALEVGLKATTDNELIIESANSVSELALGELESLGKQLQNTINAAYEDGLLDIDELEAIQNIRNDMREIVNALNTSGVEAEFDMLKMNWSGVQLTPESFEKMITEWNNVIQNEVKPALESTVKENLKTLEGNIAYLKLALEKDPDNAQLKAELEKAEQALQDYINENPLESLTLQANVEAVTFALNSLKDAFATEIAEAKNKGWFNYDEQVEITLNDVSLTVDIIDEGKGDRYTAVGALVSNIAGAYTREVEAVSPRIKDSLSQMIESMAPTMKDFEELSEQARKAGQTVPQEIRAGLNDYNEINALSGSTDAILYKVGQQLTTDEVFLNTLATAENAGKQIDFRVAKGLLNNIDYVTDEATGLVIGIKNAVTGETIQITPVLEKNLAQMGVNLGDALGGKYQYVYDETTGVLKSIVDSATGNSVWINDELKTKGEEVGKNLSEGLKNGVEKDEQTLSGRLQKWASGVLKTIKNTFEIRSPSKATEEMGKYLSEGLNKGMSTNTIKDKLSSMWTTAKNWWDKSKGTLKSYTPSIGSIKDKVSSAWTTAKDWWNKNRSNLSYTPSIGSIKTKLSSAWTSAKDWWNKNRSSLSYTPSIGSIKDKVVSAWNSAKKWWNSNANLSTKLNIQTPKLTVNWGEVSALGKTFKYPKSFSLKFAANGGIFNQGSLVWAGERGAEIVANAAGGKTGVMNVQQMQDAVYEGVYAAVVAAMGAVGGNSGSQPVNVYLDGRQITASVEKRQRERGASIMGNQVYSY